VFGRQVVHRFRAMEATAWKAIARDVHALETAIKADPAIPMMHDPELAPI
jgi:hypothetical protein